VECTNPPVKADADGAPAPAPAPAPAMIWSDRSDHFRGVAVLPLGGGWVGGGEREREVGE